MALFPAQFNLSDLDGRDGFVINGEPGRGLSGRSVSSAGDINGDGVDDLIIWAIETYNPSPYSAGYVVFGNSQEVSRTLELADLDGSNGFAINGVASRTSAVTAMNKAGDINGDGIDDLIIGARYANPNGERSGASYVVFGQIQGFSRTLELADLDGRNGFTINGVAAGDNAGYSVSVAGDINGDGIDDLIIASPFIDPNGTYSGASYVVFGRTGGFDRTLELADLDGSNGFVINGITVGTFAGSSVSGAGDINGDGIDDLIIGARFANHNEHGSTGASYVVFGQTQGFSPTLELAELNGSNGFAINGVAVWDQAGVSVSGAGDVNGDGIDDLIIGAYRGNSDTGASYVIFGRTGGFSRTLELAELNGSNGFAINGIAIGDFFGISVSGAGDINGDGIDDLIIGASSADPNGLFSAGASYVVFGRVEGFSRTLELTSLDGSNGFAVNGAMGDFSGNSVSGAGDVNGDGIDDLIIGAPFADPNGRFSGASYVVFGQLAPATISIQAMDGDATEAGATPGQFTITRTGSTTNVPLTVSYTVATTATATSGDDYIPLAGTIEIPIGASSVMLPLMPIDDEQVEGTEAVTVELLATDTYTLDEQATRATLAIADDDIAGFRLNATTLSVSESGTRDCFTAVLSAQPLTDVVLQVTSTDTGEVTVAPATLTFTPANWNIAQTVTVTGVDDTRVDGNQTSAVTLSVVVNQSDAAFAGLSSQSISVTTTDDDSIEAPTLPDDGMLTDANDVFTGSEAQDVVFGGVGDDTLIGGGGSDRLAGEAGNDRVLGGDGADHLLGGDGNDSLVGGTGNDRMLGGNGVDTLLGGVGDDTLIAGAGNDRLLGSGGNDLMRGNLGDDLLNGGTGNDRLFGGAGSDSLNGQDGDDVIRGGAGRDVIRGGAGNDRIAGELGNDVIATGAGNDRIAIRTGQGFDRVTDFEDRRDRIVLGGLRFSDLRITQQGSDVLIRGNGERLLLLQNVGIGQITAADFIS